MGKFREFLKWAWVIIAAAFSLFAGVLVYGWRRAKEGLAIGEARQRAKDDREDLQHAEETGDDNAVLSEWRKHRGDK